MSGRAGRLMLIGLLVFSDRLFAADTPNALVVRAEALREQKQWAAAIELLQQASSHSPADLHIALLLGETLSWERRFSEAERVYRDILRRHASSQDAASGLARTLLWQGRYAEARARFLTPLQSAANDLDSMEGAATAAYWAGDWTTAQREFAAIMRRDPHRQFAREALRGISAATRSEQSLGTEGVDDDQPLRSLRLEARESFHSDPLTQWSVAAGSYALRDRRMEQSWRLPFVRFSQRVTLPWQRLRIDSSLGMVRYGDGATRPLGNLAVRHAIGANAEVIASIEHRELVATATAHAFHPGVTTMAAGWHREGDAQRVLAALDAGRLRYDDHNRGWFAQGYALVPVIRRHTLTLAAGASLAARDTSESRFFVEAVSSSRSADGSFAYSYRGSYTPYWTPQRLREARAVVSLTSVLPHASSISVHADGGIARDVAEGFGPFAGSGNFPSSISRYQFDRRFHPWRLSAALTTRLTDSLHLDLGVERGATAFYRARTFHATLVRRR